MSKVEILCDNEKQMMFEFSRRCIGRLNNHLPLKFFLSLFQDFLDANVLKELEKDRLVIEHAAVAFEDGKDRTDVDVHVIFEGTKKIDAAFVKKLPAPVFSIEVKYDDFAEVRKRRIACLLNMAFDLLENWKEEVPFIETVRSAYTEERFSEILGEVLHLYNLETKMLSNSITFHSAANKIKDIFAEKLFTTMERTAEQLASEYTRGIYQGKGSSCVNRI